MRRPIAFFTIALCAITAYTESWILTTDECPRGAACFSFGGNEDQPVVESIYVEAIFGDAVVSRIDFADDRTAFITFAETRYQATFDFDSFNYFVFEVIEPHQGFFVLLVSPEHDGKRNFAYVLQQDYAPFHTTPAVPISEYELNEAERREMDIELIKALQKRGVRYIQYRGTIEIIEP